MSLIITANDLGVDFFSFKKAVFLNTFSFLFFLTVRQQLRFLEVYICNRRLYKVSINSGYIVHEVRTQAKNR